MTTIEQDYRAIYQLIYRFINGQCIWCGERQFLQRLPMGDEVCSCHPHESQCEEMLWREIAKILGLIPTN